MDIDERNSHGETALIRAATQGQTEEVLLLVRQGANVHCRDNYHESALYRALANHHRAVVELLLQKGANLTQYETDLLELLEGTAEEPTPEQLKQREEQRLQNAQEWGTALEIGDTATIQRILDASLGVNYMGRLIDGLTVAASEGYVETVRFLLQCIVDVNRTYTYKESALYHAIAKNHQPIVELLFQAGAELTIHEAADLGDVETVRILMDCGVALTVYDAALLGDVNILRSLLDSGADINNGSEWEPEAPLHLAAWRGNAAVVRLLLERGAEVDAGNVDFETPLILAVGHNHHEAARALLEGGADVNLISHYREAALLEANDLEMSLLLLQHGADVNGGGNDIRRGRNYATALIVAADAGRLDQAQLLLEWGAEVNARDGNGNTALMFAADNSQSEMVSLLLRAGADVHAVNQDGQTALQWVRKSRAEGTVENYISTEGDTEVIAMLKQASTEE